MESMYGSIAESRHGAALAWSSRFFKWHHISVQVKCLRQFYGLFFPYDNSFAGLSSTL